MGDSIYCISRKIGEGNTRFLKASYVVLEERSSLGESKESLAVGNLRGLRTGKEEKKLTHRLSLKKTNLCLAPTTKASPREHWVCAM